VTAPLSDDEIQAALAAEIECAPWCNSNYASGGPGCDCLDTHRRPAAALIPVVRDIAAREAARELEAAADAITEGGRPDLTTVDQVNAVNDAAQWLDDRARALGLDPTHGKATT
jgi:hypothetical protein